ncbi:hypothetical protein B0A55_06708 [Friedmanniomyces simplex]|uniref:Histone chaperone domain-containing protein n=1 Tax=Friedmanniomyces simplex TaxID=329884 RepID=A0A4U0X6D2_9PEZI|nr:hypothetical protein B0A55_06708 [Friedmanniomyces simplex]
MSTQQQQTEAPAGTGASDNDYVSRTGQKQAPVRVQKDEDTVEDPIDPATADSDKTLEQDERSAIDSNNVIEGGRTRGAAKKSGTYADPGDEEGMPPPSDGTSRIVTASANDV